MLKSLVGSALVVLMGAASAAPVLFFGENQSPAGGVSGNPVTARNAFLAGLTGVVSEGFESFTNGQATPLALSFAGSGGSTLTATLTGSGAVFNTPAAGRYNTTPGGTNLFETTSSSFVINFGTAISAFGFYGTDIGDFDGQLTVTLTDVLNQTTTLAVPHTIDAANGSLLFFGLIDPTTSYVQVSFSNTGSVGDQFGFDDLVIGDRRQIVDPGTPVPEPGSLALTAAALMGLGFAARRRNHVR